ncbi:hypothetical protein ACJMK2_019157 [Sinanodonta woodiana]|uniref:CX domain-containing protein n=1 Tax=Sinanodonta woodiana TaxID=1069815 RepID=A0ABD3UFI8_SINWO
MVPWMLISITAGFVFIRSTHGQEDCHRTASDPSSFYTESHRCSYVVSQGGGSEWTGFNCGADHECCDNGCCQTNPGIVLSDIETVGLVLSTTAMFTIIIMMILIYGATFFINYDNNFSKSKKIDTFSKLY